MPLSSYLPWTYPLKPPLFHLCSRIMPHLFHHWLLPLLWHLASFVQNTSGVCVFVCYHFNPCHPSTFTLMLIMYLYFKASSPISVQECCLTHPALVRSLFLCRDASLSFCSILPLPSAEDLPSIFDHIEGEVDALDEVIAGHGDFCALLASRGTAVAFMKAGCTHGNIVNRPNFSLSPADLNDIPGLARSIGNRFVTQIWAKGGRSLAGDEARSHLKPVINSYLVLTFSLKLEFTL